MKRTRLVSLLVLFLTFPVIFSAGCRPDLSHDPVKWSFAGGDGSWDSNSRKWSVYLSPGETKSVTIRLSNSSSDNLVVLVQPEFSNNYHISSPLEGPFVAGTGNVIKVPAGGSTVFTLKAIAYSNVRAGSHKYVIDYGWSTSEKVNPDWWTQH